MFTFSRGTQRITIVLALSLAMFLGSAQAHAAARVKLSPSQQTLRVGQSARVSAQGKRCTVRLPFAGSRHFNGGKRWSWRINRSGRFQVQLRCANGSKRAYVLVSRPAHQSSQPVRPAVDPNPATDPADGSQPYFGMSWDEMDAYYTDNCYGSAQRASTPNCKKVIAIIMDFYFHDNHRWFSGWDQQHPYGNPYNKGWCFDWVKFKRPDIFLNIQKVYYQDYYNSGMTMSDDLDWGSGYNTQDKDNAWIRWARRAGYYSGPIPKAGGIMVFPNHVAIVEKLVPPSKAMVEAGITSPGVYLSEMGAPRGVVTNRYLSTDPQALAQYHAFFVY